MILAPKAFTRLKNNNNLQVTLWHPKQDSRLTAQFDPPEKGKIQIKPEVIKPVKR